MINTS